MTEEQERRRKEGEKLDAELTRVGLSGKRRGYKRDRAEILGVTPHAVTAWLAGRNPIPGWVWNVLKMWELLSAEGREKFRAWLDGKR